MAVVAEPGPQLGLAAGFAARWADPADQSFEHLLRLAADWRRPGTLVTVLLMEFGDYAMMRRMLRGIRERAEAERHP
jgi:hypothetical protein